MWDREAAENFPSVYTELFDINSKERATFLRDCKTRIHDGTASAKIRAQYLQVLGDERGATTGRGRSVGYLDTHWLEYAIRVTGAKMVALTRFDMLSDIRRIDVVRNYIDSQSLQPCPGGKIPIPAELEGIATIKETWNCWKGDIGGCTKMDRLPPLAQKFIVDLEKVLDTSINLIGTGPGRDALIVR